ncbi:synaptotagmin-15-like protein [Dinothrombium tinctorium]|uniref:Synaptotagmin-15-like protein n=1 Tax=Dinothrombium tinctorium TaxID=1965070 RepID=A0A3S3PPU6_9ACAR|nr:synaptotagmin-15-like protein [Dinothrombium tinctorium]RWS02891.1 synaptotagmin-15-like protein [Dinothrombium tinctorium]RWS05881.1 synaptotagmin-15-like protein [Dinothrombium tinctorium]RWS05928.1 synaptotagmin-15-like protein [Dinothrombium tinctorium]
MPLKSASLPVHDNAYLLVSLCYLPSMERLSVGVLRSRNSQFTHSLDSKGNLKKLSCDKMESYAKVTLMCGGEKIKSMRSSTITVATNTDLIYNQTFGFIVPSDFLDETTLIIAICIKSRIKPRDVIGKVISGPVDYSSNDKITHWGRMLAEPRPVTEWRVLHL